MARPRKNDPTGHLKPILLDFARQVAATVERLTLDRVRAALDGGATIRASASGQKRGARPGTRCYYPGCKNIAAPRFGMFCAAEHKNLSAGDKQKYRAQHAAGGKRKRSRKK